jgi:hypothetical protein
LPSLDVADRCLERVGGHSVGAWSQCGSAVTVWERGHSVGARSQGGSAVTV